MVYSDKNKVTGYTRNKNGTLLILMQFCILLFLLLDKHIIVIIFHMMTLVFQCSDSQHVQLFCTMATINGSMVQRVCVYKGPALKGPLGVEVCGLNGDMHASQKRTTRLSKKTYICYI